MGATLVLDQPVAAEPAQVYAAWASANGLSRWWWPHIPDTTYNVDARVGGRYEIRSAAAGIGVRGEFLELDLPHSMRITWNWMNDGVSGVEEHVTVDFTPTREGTLVALTHQLADSAGDGDDLRQGWHNVLARLAGTVGE